MRQNAHLTPLPGPVRDAGLLVARVLLGAILMAHGWQKLHDNGLDATAKMFDGMGIPMADAAAWFATFVELIGGAFLILGFLTPLAGLLETLNLLGAWWYVHRGHGVFADKHGWELVASLGLASAVFALVGPGRFSIDGLLTMLRDRKRPVTAEADRVETSDGVEKQDVVETGDGAHAASTDV